MDSPVQVAIITVNFCELEITVLFSGATPESNALFGQGSGPILLDDLACTGMETRLIDCTHGGIEVTNCIHSSDAGVRCVVAGI